MKKLVLFFALAGLPLLAASSGPCPTATGGDINYINAGGLCNVVITFNANGSITTTVVNANPYDGVEDTLVGVVNNTGSAIKSLTLTGTGATPQLFGFDGDGACESSGGGTPGGVYESKANCVGATDPNGYGGPNVTFSGINAGLTSGTVNFGGTLIAANGGTAWFSLEEPPSLNLIVNGVPEPGSIMLLGTCLGACAMIVRRRRKTS